MSSDSAFSEALRNERLKCQRYDAMLHKLHARIERDDARARSRSRSRSPSLSPLPSSMPPPVSSSISAAAAAAAAAAADEAAAAAAAAASAAASAGAAAATTATLPAPPPAYAAAFKKARVAASAAAVPVPSLLPVPPTRVPVAPVAASLLAVPPLPTPTAAAAAAVAAAEAAAAADSSDQAPLDLVFVSPQRGACYADDEAHTTPLFRVLSPPAAAAAAACDRFVSPPRQAARTCYQPAAVLPATGPPLGLAEHLAARLEQDRRLFEARHMASRAELAAAQERLRRQHGAALALAVDESRCRRLLEDHEADARRGAVSAAAISAHAPQRSLLLLSALEGVEATARDAVAAACADGVAALAARRAAAGLASVAEAAAAARTAAAGEECAAFVALARAAAAEREGLLSLRVVGAAEQTARVFLQNVQRVAWDTLLRARRADGSALATRARAADEAVAAERYCRMDVEHFEAAMRATLAGGLRRVARAELCGEEYRASAQHHVHDAEARVRLGLSAAFVSGVREATERSGGARALQEAERRGREFLEEGYWLSRSELARAFAATGDALRVCAHSREAVTVEEGLQRRQLAEACAEGYATLAAWRAASATGARGAAGTRRQLCADEAAAREAIDADEQEAARRVLAESLLQRYWLRRTALQCEAGIEAMGLAEALRRLNGFGAAASVTLEGARAEEATARARAEAAEEAARAELVELRDMFAQRFSFDHAATMLCSAEARERRALAWHEVALRNALHEYRASRLAGAGPDFAASPAQASAHVQHPMFHPAAVAAPPQRRPPAAEARICEERKMDALMERMSNVQTKMRERVAAAHVPQQAARQSGRDGGGGGGGGMRSWPPIRLTKEMYDLFDEDFFPPDVSEHFLLLAHGAVSRGSFVPEEEQALPRLCATMLQHVAAVADSGAVVPPALQRIRAMLKLLHARVA